MISNKNTLHINQVNLGLFTCPILPGDLSDCDRTPQGSSLTPGLLAPGLHKVASGASAACGQTHISWTNYDQNHVYFVQVLHGKCTKRYLTQTKILYDRHRLSKTDTYCPWQIQAVHDRRRLSKTEAQCPRQKQNVPDRHRLSLTHTDCPRRWALKSTILSPFIS